MDLKKTVKLCESCPNDYMDASEQLKHFQKNSLEQTASALECIISQQRLSEQLEVPNIGNIVDAKRSIVDSMVNLAIVASDGDYDRTKEVLAEYGIEDMI